MSQTSKFQVELTKEEIKNMMGAFDFIIDHGYDEANDLIELRQSLAKLIGEAPMLLCDYCGYAAILDDSTYKVDGDCPRCGKGHFQLGKRKEDENV